MSFSQISSQFWQKLANAVQPVLLLDYDGTLAPFRVERDQAVPYPGVRGLLAEIRNLTATRLVIISGRSIDDLLPLLGLDSPPEIWGCHGWERLLPDGQRPPVLLPEQVKSGLKEASAWIVRQDLLDRCELKPASVALHWRGLPVAERERLERAVDAGWAPLAERRGLQLHAFDGGLELRCPGRDKGTAIREILAEADSDSPVAFLGDDLTDEDGFRAVKGVGLGILVRNEPRPSAADIHLHPPEELVDFLERWRDTACRSGAKSEVDR